MAGFVWFFERGPLPLLVSMPRAGTEVPAAIALRLAPAARAPVGADRHLPRLFDFLGGMGANLLVAVNAPCVIDLAADPADSTPGVLASGPLPCAPASGAGESACLPGQAPGEGEIGLRVAAYWQPYRDKLAAALAEARARHGHALLLDLHAAGTARAGGRPGAEPDMVIGTADDAPAAARIGAALLAAAAAFPQFSAAWREGCGPGGAARGHGGPGARVHAVRLELSPRTCVVDGRFDAQSAERLRPVLRALVERFVALGAALD